MCGCVDVWIKTVMIMMIIIKTNVIRMNKYLMIIILPYRVNGLSDYVLN